MARWLANRGARRIALLGRHAPDERARGVIAELEAGGAAVLVLQGDVACAADDLYQLGLGEGTRIHLDELPGEWVVADKMGGRWYRRLDVYFGDDREAAKEFGVKHLTLRWCP